jgi:hypothetical protein
MGQKNRYTPHKRRGGALPSSDTRSLRRPPSLSDLPRPVTYGKPFIVVEDAEKQTFVFEAGNWVAYSASIAECRQTCQVKELPQRVNGRIRYEIRAPV